MKSTCKKQKTDINWIIPNDVTLEIMSYCTPDELGNLASVSKEFNELSSSDVLWKKIFITESDDSEHLQMVTKDYKNHLKKQYDELFAYQTTVKSQELPPVKVVLLGDAISDSHKSIKNQIMIYNSVFGMDACELVIDFASISLGPKKHKIGFWDTSANQVFFCQVIKNSQNADLVVFLPKNMEQLRCFHSLLTGPGYYGTGYQGLKLCFSNNSEILEAALTLGCEGLIYKEDTPTDTDLRKLNKMIIKMAGAPSVSMVVEEEMAEESKPETSECSIM